MSREGLRGGDGVGLRGEPCWSAASITRLKSNQTDSWGAENATRGAGLRAVSLEGGADREPRPAPEGRAVSQVGPPRGRLRSRCASHALH